jgi:hypothetical protein
MLPLLPNRRRDGFQRDGMSGTVQRFALAAAMTGMPFIIVMLEVAACSSGRSVDRVIVPASPTAEATAMPR